MLMAHGLSAKRIPASPGTSVRAQAVGSPGLQLMEYSEPPVASELGQSPNKLPLPSAFHHFPYRFLSIETYFAYNFISHIVLYIKFKLTVKQSVITVCLYNSHNSTACARCYFFKKLCNDILTAS